MEVSVDRGTVVIKLNEAQHNKVENCSTRVEPCDEKFGTEGNEGNEEKSNVDHRLTVRMAEQLRLRVLRFLLFNPSRHVARVRRPS